jgi:hypothetical protein
MHSPRLELGPLCAVSAALLLQAVMSEGSVENGTLAESQAQAAAIWRVREGVTESLQRRGEQQQTAPTLACLYRCAAAGQLSAAGLAAGLTANTPTMLSACPPTRVPACSPCYTPPATHPHPLPAVYPVCHIQSPAPETHNTHNPLFVLCCNFNCLHTHPQVPHTSTTSACPRTRCTHSCRTSGSAWHTSLT